MNNMPGLLKVLLVAVAIPVIGFAVSFFILNDVNQDLKVQGMPDVTLLCDAVRSGQLGNEVTPDLRGACQEVANIVLLGQGSVFAAVIGIFIPLLYWLASVLAGESRKRIAAVFPVVLRLSVLLIAASVLLQGAILTYAAYISESYAIGRVHFFIIGAIGLGALFGGIKLIGAAMSFGGKLKMTAFGKVLNAADAPQLFSFVHSLAKKLAAKAPKNIVVGLEPTFYVTNSDIQVPGRDNLIKGETLYISAPLARLFTQEEFASVLGHELGHFRGEDTIYSMRFAPVYAGLGKALGAIATDEEEGASGLAKLPAIAMLSYMYEIFATNVAKIGRDREHRADEAGAEAGSPLALSTALIKVSLYSDLWNHARKQNIERLNQGKIATNLSLVFQDTAKYDVEHESIEEIMRSTLEQSISHPTDSHPPVSKRLKELGIKPEQITRDMLLVPENAAIQLLDKPQEIEEEITLLEHKLMVAYGVAKPPEETERNHLLNATYSLAAAVVCADGQIDAQEIAVAEAIGQKLFEDFDSVEFREYCNRSEQVPDVAKLSEAMSEVLEDEHKELILKYLRAISEADGNLSADEEALLKQVAAGLGISHKTEEGT
ncbi:MAG: M48 family metalloprotease [Pseudomonadales bacterium]|nr:M48 family metalloprotease [Pseudomonadales bacterium]